MPDRPTDPWIAWLSRPPLNEVAPPPRGRPSWGGLAVMIGIGGFWTAIGAFAWRSMV